MMRQSTRWRRNSPAIVNPTGPAPATKTSVVCMVLLNLSAGHATDRHEIRDRAKEIRLAQEPIDFLLPLAKLTGGDDFLLMGRAADLKKIRTETCRLEDHHIGFDRDVHEPGRLE